MYYPICFLMPNAGPCIKAAYKPSELAAYDSSTIEALTQASATATPAPTTLSPAELAEKQSVSSYKAMLRSIYSSRARQSELSEFWATAVPQQTHAEYQENDISLEEPAETAAMLESEDKSVDISPMSSHGLVLVDALACVKRVARALF